jgi:CheY-like chemotaxis protein
VATILIVDDDADGREAVARFLRRAGHEVVCASGGSEALAMIPTAAPQLVILDVRMPVMGGLSFLEVLRNYHRGSTLPVVLLTAMSDPAVAQRAAKFGVTHVFVKSNYTLPELLECVNALVAPPPGASLRSRGRRTPPSSLQW